MRLYFILLVTIFMFSSCNTFGNKPSDKEATSTDNPILHKDTLCLSTNQQIIIDSEMTFNQSIEGSKAPQGIIDQLVLIDVEYYSTDDKLHRGQLLLNRSIEKDIKEIFELIKETHFPIYQVKPIVVFDWNDGNSMAANNTSSFCYRKVGNSKNLSRHAYGKAIDINPYFNPLVWKAPNQNKPIEPKGAKYDTNHSGTLYAEHPVVKEFKKRGFTWGHDFKAYYDNHHFHKD